MKYNKYPKIKADSSCKSTNLRELIPEFRQNKVLLFELYPGIDRNQIKQLFTEYLSEYEIIDIDIEYADQTRLQKVLADIGTDRIFAKMQNLTIIDFYLPESITALETRIAAADNVIVLGMGTNLLANTEGLKVHLSLPRWQIQTNYRLGISNWLQSNFDAENTVKFKFGYFLDWRIADQIKVSQVDEYDYLIDCTTDDLIALTSEKYRNGLQAILGQPFRLTPFFDPGVWGGQWMREKFNLDSEPVNYAWSFDGVPEENSICYQINENQFNYPGIDIVLLYPKQLLGNQVYSKYGPEFPIRFDLLDTIDGQNLSLQVHPTKQYIKEQFNMNYTQEESYYILDTKGDESYVYIGLKTGVSKKQFFEQLEYAYEHNTNFEVEQFVNKIKCQKGDHFLIPAGTIHCSGENVMVLEISQTPYIFTFKLWDWERVDLNGKPRPINTKHGKQVVNENYNTKYVNDYLYNRFEQIDADTIRSGLAKTQDINSFIIKTSKQREYQTKSKFHMLNVVDGNGIVISSVNNKFADYIVNQYETVIIPATIDKYVVTPINCEEVKYVQVYNK